MNSNIIIIKYIRKYTSCKITPIKFKTLYIPPHTITISKTLRRSNYLKNPCCYSPYEIGYNLFHMDYKQGRTGLALSHPWSQMPPPAGKTFFLTFGHLTSKSDFFCRAQTRSNLPTITLQYVYKHIPFFSCSNSVFSGSGGIERAVANGKRS